MPAEPPEGTLLAVEQLTAGYGEVDVLTDVSVRVEGGEIVTLIGPNGAGKSTLLKAVVGLLPPRGGRVRFAGADLAGLRPNAVARQGIGYVPQTQNVFPSLTVLENLEMGGYLLDDPLEGALEEVFAHFPGLRDRRRQRAGTLSGGERQMVAIGMALMVKPRLLLLDEPSAGLAPAVVEALFAKVRAINAAGVAILMVEQNAREALGFSDRGYVLVMGRNRREGPGPSLAEDSEVRVAFLGG
jgi:ABC-type branched-subunit amino acid transport system ATPase component